MAATSKTDMVVSAQHNATRVGQEILAEGGNAIDAAVAVGYALAVVHPCCGNIGGGGFMLIHLANGNNTVINFREKAPAAYNAVLLKKYMAYKKRFPYLATGIPGSVMALNTALSDYGTMSLQQVISPAIQLAQQGYPLGYQDARLFEMRDSGLREHPNTARIFLNNYETYQQNDVFKQPQLANTLNQIAKYGSDAFYKGTLTKQIIAANKRLGGVMSLKDFAHYTIEKTKPITCDYRGYQLISVPPPGAGVTVCEILNITKGYPLELWGYHTYKSVRVILEAMRFAHRDRKEFLGDPDFTQNPTKKLLSEKYAARIREHIDKQILPEVHAAVKVTAGWQTTSYSIVDKYGNAIAVTTSLEDFFGAKVVAGNTGFLLNNQLGDFNENPHLPNSPAGNKRPMSGMAPTMLLKNKKIFMVLGTPGGPTIPSQIVETIENVFDYHMPLKKAVNAPRFYLSWPSGDVHVEPDAFTEAVKKQLMTKGYHLIFKSPYGTKRWGGMAAIEVKKNGVILGVMDERRPGGNALGN